MHWARWGDPALAQPLPDSVRNMLLQHLGAGAVPAGSFETVEPAAVQLPTNSLPAGFMSDATAVLGTDNVRTDHEQRLRHTRGKSTPDLIKIRSGDGTEAPDAVLLPGTHDEVLAAMEVCSRHHIAVVPFGGGTSVVGGLAAQRDGFNGIIALDLSRLCRLVSVDPESQTAELEAGLRGPEAEALLGEHGFTLGHFPQSFEYASIGGFAATRSSGQASSGYGRFDSMVLGLKAATPLGTLALGAAPSSAAGPDLRQVMLGSEGAFGVITSVTLKVRPQPESKVYEAWAFSTFAAGCSALRRIVQDGGPVPTILRLADEAETSVGQAISKGAGAAGTACLMITGYEGAAQQVEAGRAHVSRILTGLGGMPLGTDKGDRWAAGRYQEPYLRDSLLDSGILVETLETAAFWSNLGRVYASVRGAVAESLTRQGTPPMVLCHVSHIYGTGASLYFTVVARQAGEPLAQWEAAKAAASAAISESGATITHHHAVGRMHVPWLEQEIGPVGVEILRAIKERIDPKGILNPGVLVP
jgi:alkyldihydroxyacetonephosphate synthase